MRKAACHFKLGDAYEKQNNLRYAFLHFQKAFKIAEYTEHNEKVKENYRERLAKCLRLISQRLGEEWDD